MAGGDAGCTVSLLDCLAVGNGVEYSHLGKRVELPFTTEQLINTGHQITRLGFAMCGRINQFVFDDLLS